MVCKATVLSAKSNRLKSLSFELSRLVSAVWMNSEDEATVRAAIKAVDELAAEVRSQMAALTEDRQPVQWPEPITTRPYWGE